MIYELTSRKTSAMSERVPTHGRLSGVSLASCHHLASPLFVSLFLYAGVSFSATSIHALRPKFSPGTLGTRALETRHNSGGRTAWARAECGENLGVCATIEVSPEATGQDLAVTTVRRAQQAIQRTKILAKDRDSVRSTSGRADSAEKTERDSLTSNRHSTLRRHGRPSSSKERTWKLAGQYGKHSRAEDHSLRSSARTCTAHPPSSPSSDGVTPASGARQYGPGRLPESTDGMPGSANRVVTDVLTTSSELQGVDLEASSEDALRASSFLHKLRRTLFSQRSSTPRETAREHRWDPGA
ncbi:hypothetical protein OH76DRAFT_255655 [Lentinus brumalis]|uniref:Uncharacterized protein n=1 Tax=Lentinus brumalis TaxID=2498619 RepID=A0A371CL81_9APHY|nr:hypothetical protein OH76DRAFT_255655 [Polyporus brumalis]